MKLNVYARQRPARHYRQRAATTLLVGLALSIVAPSRAFAQPFHESHFAQNPLFSGRWAGWPDFAAEMRNSTIGLLRTGAPTSEAMYLVKELRVAGAILSGNRTFADYFRSLRRPDWSPSIPLPVGVPEGLRIYNALHPTPFFGDFRSTSSIIPGHPVFAHAAFSGPMHVLPNGYVLFASKLANAEAAETHIVELFTRYRESGKLSDLAVAIRASTGSHFLDRGTREVSATLAEALIFERTGRVVRLPYDIDYVGLLGRTDARANASIHSALVRTMHAPLNPHNAMSARELGYALAPEGRQGRSPTAGFMNWLARRFRKP